MRFASDEIMSDVRRMRDEYSGLLRGAVQRGMEAGEFVEADAAIVTLQIFGMCNWSWTWYRPNGAWSAEDIAEDVHERVISTGSRGTGRRSALSADVPDLVRATMDEIAADSRGGELNMAGALEGRVALVTGAGRSCAGSAAGSPSRSPGGRSGCGARRGRDAGRAGGGVADVEVRAVAARCCRWRPS